MKTNNDTITERKNWEEAATSIMIAYDSSNEFNLNDAIADAIGSALCANAVRQLRELLPSLTGDQRLAVFGDITEGYCKECGTDNPDCQCWNDE
jgi:hypothetical protein